jgi:hypothetical protein
MGLFARAVAAIDGGKFKAANARDKNFTKASIGFPKDLFGSGGAPLLHLRVDALAGGRYR